MNKGEKMADVILCGDCATVQADGIPCGIMFSGDQVTSCNNHCSDPKKHIKLAEKYGMPPKTEDQKEYAKGVK